MFYPVLTKIRIFERSIDLKHPTTKMIKKFKTLFFERYSQPLFYYDPPNIYKKVIAKKERFFLIVREERTHKKYIVIYHLKRDLKTNKVLQVDRFFRGDNKWILTRKNISIVAIFTKKKYYNK